jgi:anti-anti-sigma factor
MVQFIKDVVVVSFTDSAIIDSQIIEQIKRDLFDLVDKQNHKRMILDMSKVQHLSSAALGVLIPLGDKIKKNKGSLVLCSVSEGIRKIFKITRLDKHFKFCADEGKALSSLGVTMD